MRHSGRGGVRAGGGRPSLWQHQPTCTIRIPKRFEKMILEIAQDLDKCSEDKQLGGIKPKTLKEYDQNLM